ncbi:uncharacterized protein LOC129788830 isoform X2 [Lutzomyia longipalpis]|uniref:uncharacterized protein LOC129788830 isoform X2 n=1 Tax=Lutzomyia longipalpis TaxID=7200 RepID=UPI0024833503|nr:uncharacterized protein LOC129788830 isoform X2 [Lutzomyia longipalpis]
MMKIRYMLKTACTVTFLLFLLSLWGCTHGSPLRARKNQDDDRILPWMRTCGHDIEQRLNDTSIVKGKHQKISLLESSGRFIVRYLSKLNKTIQVIEEREVMTDLGSLLINNMPSFNNRSLRATHRDLQIYIAIFDKVWRDRKLSNQGFTNHKKEVLEELQKLRQETQSWLCIVEDMLNGTDHLRIKMRYLKEKVMEKKINEIIGQEKFTTYLKMSLTGIEKFAKDFQKFVKKRVKKLKDGRNKQRPRRLNCLGKNNCRSRRRKAEEKLMMGRLHPKRRNTIP